MKKKIKYTILIVGIIIIVSISSLNKLANLLTKNNYLPRDININVVNKVDYNEKDFLFITEEEIDDNNTFFIEVGFNLITANGEIELFNVRYQGTWEKIKYRKHDNYIYFWLNGNEYELRELNSNKPDKELRMKTDAQIYKYNISTGEFEKIKIDNPDKTVIIDVLRIDDEEIIIKEIATKQTSSNIWKDMKTVIDNKKYDFTITDYYLFNSKSINIKNKIIIPTINSIIILDEENIETKNIYQNNYPYSVKLYNYNNDIIAQVDGAVIKYDENFEKINELKLPEMYYKTYVIDNKVILYGVTDNTVKIGYLDLETFEIYDLKSKELAEKINDISLKYNSYDNTIILYDKVKNINVCDVNL